MSSTADDEGLNSPGWTAGNRRPEALQRRSSSASFFGAIKNFVAAPLFWLNSEPSRDVGEKRSLPSNGLAGDDRVVKKQRRMSPLREDTPPLPSSATLFEEASKGISQLSVQQSNGYPSLPEPLPASLNRSSSALNKDRDVTDRGQYRWSSTNSPRSVSHNAFVGINARDGTQRSVSRGSLMATPSSPYRIRKSLTPQPLSLPLSPNRREFSVSRPLMWAASSTRASLSPAREFRREASAPLNRRQLIWDPAIGITTKEELEGSSRASTPAPSTPAERALQALNSFRKPLVPPSFADDPDAHTFLKGGRKYAPPPLPPAILESVGFQSTSSVSKERPALTGKSARMVRPYSGEGGMKKLLKKRALERQTSNQTASPTSEPLRDIPLNDISTQTEEDFTFSSIDSGLSMDEEELAPSMASSSFPKVPLGGRIAGSRTSAPTKPTNPNAPALSSLKAERVSHRSHEPSVKRNKFAAPDVSEEEELEPHLQGLPSKEDLLQGASIPFEIPSGFSFNFTPVNEPIKPKDVKVSENMFQGAKVDHSETKTTPSFSATILSEKQESTKAIPGEKPNSVQPSSDSNSPSLTLFPSTAQSATTPESERTPAGLFPIPKPAPSLFSFTQFASPQPNKAAEASSISKPEDAIKSLPFPFPSAPTVSRETTAQGAKDVPLPLTTPLSSDLSKPDKAPTIATPVTPVVAPTSFAFSFAKQQKPVETSAHVKSSPPLQEASITPPAETTSKPTPPLPLFGLATSSATSSALPANSNLSSPEEINKSSPFEPKFGFGTNNQGGANGSPFSFSTIAPSSEGKETPSPFTVTANSAPSTQPVTFEKPEPPNPKTPEPVPMSDRMEESPARDPSTNKTSGFSFGGGTTLSTSTPFSFAPSPAITSASSAPNAPAPAPFSFGAPSITPNPFSQAAPSSTPLTSSPFVFGSATQSAPSAAPFAFGSSTATQSRGSSPFTFGASTQPNPFGGAPAASNPFNSPLQTSQPLQNDSRGSTPFTFNSPTAPSTSNPFAFNVSKPSSPALGTGALPVMPSSGSTSTPFMFGSGPPSQGEPNLFNIGSAPPTTPQGRATKGLPKRRPGSRR